MMRFFLLLLVLTLHVSIGFAEPKSGLTKDVDFEFISKRETALSIARALIADGYGKTQADVATRSMTIQRDGGTWKMRGKAVSGAPGATIEVWLSARDGCVLLLEYVK